MSVTVSLKGVVDALESVSDDVSCYLNVTTGEVRALGRDETRMAERDDALPDDLPPWQLELVYKAREVLDSSDWLALPTKYDIHEWDIMDRFASSLPEEPRSLLMGALRGKGAFQRFKNAIRRIGIEEAWFRYREQALAQLARGWRSMALGTNDSPRRAAR